MASKNQNIVYDLLGVGVGPANLSLCALIDNLPPDNKRKLSYTFLDQKECFSWHESQLFPDSLMQSSIIRDLVSLADPTCRYSFLNYLRYKGRLFQFLNSGFFIPMRSEFIDYMKWVSDQLKNIQFGSEVMSISHDKSRNLFSISFKFKNKVKSVFAENLVLGTGIRKYIPFETNHVGNAKLFHVSDYQKVAPSLHQCKILVIGSGQSAAELVYHLLNNSSELQEIVWVSNDTNYRSLDTGNFSREFYTPKYSKDFSNLEHDIRHLLLENEKAAGVGISPWLVEAIYKKIYSLKHVETSNFNKINLSPAVLVEAVKESGGKVLVDFLSILNKQKWNDLFDIVICCTGFKPSPLSYLKLDARLEDNNYLEKIKPNYSIDWNGPDKNKIYVQSMSHDIHGLADPNLTMVGPRNACIINDFLKKDVYYTGEADTLVNWFSRI